MNYEGSVQKQKTNSFVIYFDVLIHTIISDNREKEREGRLIKAREESRERETNERLQSRNPVKGGPPPPHPLAVVHLMENWIPLSSADVSAIVFV